MKEILRYASWVVLLHAFQFLFTGVPLWSQLQNNADGMMRFVGLMAVHVFAVVYVVAYELGELE